MYKKIVRKIVDRLPHVRMLKDKVAFYEEKLFVAPGHFYSPVVDKSEVCENENRIFDTNRSLGAINLNEEEQFKLLGYFKEYYKFLSFPDTQTEGSRYFYQNSFYSYADVIFLFSMTMHYKPKRIIEIGSGFSSAAMLDVNKRLFNNSIDITFIEPYPDNLKKVIKVGDKFTLIEKKVQNVDKSIFRSLNEGDFLFIDSTHVAKTDSDVLFELFEILPSLKKGVKIHFHDIFYPFEYSKEWVVTENRSWNEIYFLRSFLMYNNSFKIIAFNTFLEQFHTKWFEENMPMCLKNKGGSIWLEKLV